MEINLWGIEVSMLGIVLATVASMVIGMLWYGPLFSKEWMKLVGKKMEDDKANPADYVMNIVTSLLTATLLAWFIGVVMNLHDDMNKFLVAVIVAAMAWVAFTLPPYVNELVWEGRPSRLVLINVMHQLVTLVVFALIVVAV